MSKQTSPGRSGSTAAPIDSRRTSNRSQESATPAGSGATSVRRGQRASASPRRIPGWTPNASADSETSPICWVPPGSGASAVGACSSSARPSRATVSWKRGRRTQAIMGTHVRMRLGWMGPPSTRDGTVTSAMAPPNPLDIAADGIRTLRAFGQRIPGAGDMLARSLADAVSGRTVMITGASSGIGKAAALEIGEAGGTMLLVARRHDQLQEVADEIEDLGGVAYVHTCDLSDTDDIDRMCAEVLAQHQSAAVLVTTA